MVRRNVAIATLSFASALTQTVTAENEPIPQPECNASKPVTLRYSNTSARLYIEAGEAGERGGCVSLNEIFEQRGGNSPLYAVDPESGARSDNATGTWLLTEDLYVEDGITLNVHGGEDGDADELRILSVPGTVLNLRAHGGSLSFLNTKVVSWDEEAMTYDTNVTDGRSYVSVISEVINDDVNYTCEGNPKNNMGEARMDIVDSEVGYLGYNASESYGLTWKVRGFCTNGSNPEIFDTVNVYGNIYNSKIHDNYFGIYTYGHQQGDWRENDMYDNIQYGFDPHDDSDLLNIHDNTVWGNGNHGIIASKRCNNVSIQNNVVWGGDQAGLFLHRSTDYAIVKGNWVYNNSDAGLAIMESYNANVTDNVFENNKYGIRFSVGSNDNVFSDNIIDNSTKYGVYSYEGSDLPYVSATGRSQDNVFSGNQISGGLETIKLKESDGTAFIDNTFDAVTTIRFNDSTEVLMMGNTGLEYVDVKVNNGACFDDDSDSEFEPTC